MIGLPLACLLFSEVAGIANFEVNNFQVLELRHFKTSSELAIKLEVAKLLRTTLAFQPDMQTPRNSQSLRKSHAYAHKQIINTKI